MRSKHSSADQLFANFLKGCRGALEQELLAMCDYSLHGVSSRPAKAGDKLVTTQFWNTSTRGFSAADEPRVAVCLKRRGSGILAPGGHPQSGVPCPSCSGRLLRQDELHSLSRTRCVVAEPFLATVPRARNRLVSARRPHSPTAMLPPERMPCSRSRRTGIERHESQTKPPPDPFSWSLKFNHCTTA